MTPGNLEKLRLRIRFSLTMQVKDMAIQEPEDSEDAENPFAVCVAIFVRS